MAKSSKKAPLSQERIEEIRREAGSGRNWASEVEYGPVCACGAFLEGSTVTSWGRAVEKGTCYRHGVTRGSQNAGERRQIDVESIRAIRFTGVEIPLEDEE